DTDEDAALFGVDRDPKRVAVLPIDLIPSGLDFLRDLNRFATAENVKSSAVRDDYPILTDADAAHGRRADFARDFRDGPERRLVGAVVLGDVERMLLHEVEALAELEGRANRLAVVFGDAEQALDAVVAFGIFDPARTHERCVHWLRGRENFD